MRTGARESGFFPCLIGEGLKGAEDSAQTAHALERRLHQAFGEIVLKAILIDRNICHGLAFTDRLAFGFQQLFCPFAFVVTMGVREINRALLKFVTGGR